MNKLDKLEKDIRYYNDKIYEANNAIDALEKRIKEIEKIINNGDKWILAIGVVSFVLYMFGALIHPIVSIIGLLIMPSMMFVNLSTNKIENEMKKAKETIEEYKKNIVSYNETLNNLTQTQEVQRIINETLEGQKYNGSNLDFLLDNPYIYNRTR